MKIEDMVLDTYHDMVLALRWDAIREGLRRENGRLLPFTLPVFYQFAYLCYLFRHSSISSILFLYFLNLISLFSPFPNFLYFSIYLCYLFGFTRGLESRYRSQPNLSGLPSTNQGPAGPHVTDNNQSGAS